MKYWITPLRATFLIVTVVVLNFFASAQTQDPDAATPIVMKAGRSVIMGTWAWNIESNKLDRSEETDLWWEQIDDVRQRLVPRSGAKLAILRTKDYESVTLDDLSNAKLAVRGIDGDLLEKGTVLAIRTMEGNYAKVRIVGYRESHDVSFAEAKSGQRRWLAGLLARPNRPNYHLEVEWVLYPQSKKNL